MALGILKDLTKEDLQKASAFENGFDPLAKSLKYSQSSTYIETSLKEGKEQPVKTDGTIASQYAAKNKRTEGGQIITRITTKFNKFKSELKKAIADVDDASYDPENIAKIILENQKKPFAKIADGATQTLETVKREESSEAAVFRKQSPDTSPRPPNQSASSLLPPWKHPLVINLIIAPHHYKFLNRLNVYELFARKKIA